MEGRVLNHEARIILNAGRKEGRAKGRREGKAEGRAESIVEILEGYGAIPVDIRQKILAEREIEVLKEWLKLSLQVKSAEQFAEQI